MVSRFDALLRFASLRLGRRLGTEVTPGLTRKEMSDPSVRAQTQLSSLLKDGALRGSIRIPNTVGPMQVHVDLQAGRVTCQVELDAPKQGRPVTRVKWLIRQLRGATDDVRIEAATAHQRGPGAAELLKAVRQTPESLVADKGRDLRSFRVAKTTPIGTKRGTGRGAFIDSVLTAVDSFYSDVLQHLKAWAAAPPPMREPVETPPVTPRSLASTAHSSQDGPDPLVAEDSSPHDTSPPARSNDSTD